MDNFGIYKLISSLKRASTDNSDKKTDDTNYVEQLIKTVLPLLSTTTNANNPQKTEQLKTKNKTGAMAEVLRRHDDFVQKVYKSNGKIFKD